MLSLKEFTSYREGSPPELCPYDYIAFVLSFVIVVAFVMMVWLGACRDQIMNIRKCFTNPRQCDA